MRKGGLLELCHKPTESVFTLVLALVEGDRWNKGDRGEGTRENRGWERDLSERESGSRN